MSDPTGLNQKVREVIEDLATHLVALGGIDTSIDALRGASNKTLSDLNDQLDTLQSVTTQLAAQLSDVIGVREEGNLNTVWIFLDLMNTQLIELTNRIGAVTGDATTTVLGRLAAIERLLHCGCPPEGPDLTDPSSPCSEPYTSNPLRTQTTSLYPGRIFAGWNMPPPVGLTANSFLEVPVGDVELNRDSDVEGYRIYVQSTAPLASLNPLFPTQARTNVWVDLNLYSEDIAVSVPEGHDLTVYICVPSDVVWVNCVTLDSVEATYSTDQPFSMQVQTIVLSSIPTLTLTNTWPAGGNQHTISVPETVALNDWIGVTIRLTAGDGTRVTYLDGSGNMDGTNIDNVGDVFTVPIHTTMVTITNFTTGDPGNNPFSVEICPLIPG